MEAAQPGLALDAVAPYKSGPGLSRGGDTGAEEIESSGQEPSSSTGQSVSGENVKHCDSESPTANVLFLLQGEVPGYVCDFQEVALSFMFRANDQRSLQILDCCQ